MHLQLKQTDAGRWQVRIMLGEATFAGTGEYPSRLALDDDLARMAKSLGEGGAGRIPVVTVHEHGGERAPNGWWSNARSPDEAAAQLARSDGALHAVRGSTEFASLADWLPRGE